MLALSATLLGRADDGHAFPEAGKVYTIHRYSKANGYIYEQGNKLYVATTQKSSTGSLSLPKAPTATTCAT